MGRVGRRRRLRDSPRRPRPGRAWAAALRNPCDPATTGAAGGPRWHQDAVEVEPQRLSCRAAAPPPRRPRTPRAGSGPRYLRTTLGTHALQKMQNKGGAGSAAARQREPRALTGRRYGGYPQPRPPTTWSRLPEAPSRRTVEYLPRRILVFWASVSGCRPSVDDPAGLGWAWVCTASGQGPSGRTRQWPGSVARPAGFGRVSGFAMRRFR